MNKKLKAEQPKNKQNNSKASIIGVLSLFTVASIGYSSTVILIGVDGLVPKALIAPQMIYATIVLVKKFTK